MQGYLRRLSSSQMIILTFALAILLGSFLLMLPASTQDGLGASFFDALFTSTSAVCVTGLVVHDTAAYWSGFGQMVILLLIQIGGMGIVTLTIAITSISGKKISLKQRSTMQEAISAPKVGGIVSMTGFILKMTLIFEGAGALVMAPAFCSEFGFFKGVWYSIFHSVSAFCNAGFDLMGVKTPYSSLTHFADHPVVNMTIMMLIVIGGIGFMTWDDVRRHKLHVHKYRMQSKVIITTTTALIAAAAGYFFFFEFSYMQLPIRFWSSVFQAITPRTAGFNTVDLTSISESGLAVMILLMLVGGSPGSTAGGMKTTTFAVLLSTSVSVFHRKQHTHFFGRRITDDTIRNAATILMMYLVLFLGGGLLISRMEGLPLLTALYETASAVGTVGLSLGITAQLGTVSQTILIMLMFFGRVGGLTLIFAAMPGNQSISTCFPQERLTVG